MRNIWKRAITFILIVVILVCCLGACGNNEPAETTVPVVTQSPEEAKVLKVLILGHSLAVDCGHLLALIAKAQGYESLVVGTLYHSGCTLKQHVGFMTENSREYSLYADSKLMLYRCEDQSPRLFLQCLFLHKSLCLHSQTLL